LVEVVWLGHACFRLAGRTKSLIFDPFKGVGLPEPKVKADIILCSHSHSDHNNAKAVRHDRSVVLEGFTGRKDVDSVSIKGVGTFHDEDQGTKRGKNSAYTVSLDDFVFCHLGDLGHELSTSQVSEIGSVDVLFIPVGGFFTIGPEEARKVMESLKPKITFPMHYRLRGMLATFDPLSTVEDFLRRGDNVKRLDTASLTVTRTDLPEKPLIVIPKLR
jgi:L-ascorbate metabolism protein UlaG (beta-lactamase superfamily)